LRVSSHFFKLRGMNESNSTNSIDKQDQKFSDRLRVAWGVVEKSRHPQRPYSLDYAVKIFSDFEEVRGDRAYSDDPAIVAGMATLESEDYKQNIFIVSHQKGRNTKQKILRNFGMARPEGYRKAMRVFELAERFKMPVITFIDTPGAFPGVGAEERGQSHAIAASIQRMFELTVPSVSVVIGEGGSGGALAIGVGDRLLMLENSIYSVISPESCAAILWGNSAEAKRAAVALKMSAKETHQLGLCDEIIEEPANGAHESLEETSMRIKSALVRSLKELSKLSREDLLKQRFEKYRRIDHRHFVEKA
jgi:acetyl-CoA carboxylase carboxyl transferase subunit alpha